MHPLEAENPSGAASASLRRRIEELKADLEAHSRRLDQIQASLKSLQEDPKCQ